VAGACTFACALPHLLQNRHLQPSDMRLALLLALCGLAVAQSEFSRAAFLAFWFGPAPEVVGRRPGSPFPPVLAPRPGGAGPNTCAPCGQGANMHKLVSVLGTNGGDLVADAVKWFAQVI